jgi:hypothetical protein
VVTAHGSLTFVWWLASVWLAIPWLLAALDVMWVRRNRADAKQDWRPAIVVVGLFAAAFVLSVTAGL